MEKVITNYKIINHGPSQIGKNSDFIRTYKLEIINLDTNLSYYIWITPQGEISYTEGINDRTPTEFEFNLYKIAREYIIENSLASNLGVMEIIMLQKEYYNLVQKLISCSSQDEIEKIQNRMNEIKSLVNVGPQNYGKQNEENYAVLDDNKQVYARVSWCNAIYAKLTRKGISTERDKELFDILSNALNQVWVSPTTGKRYAPSLRVITKVLMKVEDVKKIIKVYGTLCSGFFTEENELVRVDVIFEEDEPKLIIKQFKESFINETSNDSNYESQKGKVWNPNLWNPLGVKPVDVSDIPTSQKHTGFVEYQDPTTRYEVRGIMPAAPKYKDEQTIISEEMRRQLLKNSSTKY